MFILNFTRRVAVLVKYNANTNRKKRDGIGAAPLDAIDLLFPMIIEPVSSVIHSSRLRFILFSVPYLEPLFVSTTLCLVLFNLMRLFWQYHVIFPSRNRKRRVVKLI